MFKVYLFWDKDCTIRADGAKKESVSIAPSLSSILRLHSSPASRSLSPASSSMRLVLVRRGRELGPHAGGRCLILQFYQHWVVEPARPHSPTPIAVSRPRPLYIRGLSYLKIFIIITNFTAMSVILRLVAGHVSPRGGYNRL